jgi:hypothetical protein
MNHRMNQCGAESRKIDKQSLPAIQAWFRGMENGRRQIATCRAKSNRIIRRILARRRRPLREYKHSAKVDGRYDVPLAPQVAAPKTSRPSQNVHPFPKYNQLTVAEIRQPWDIAASTESVDIVVFRRKARTPRKTAAQAKTVLYSANTFRAAAACRACRWAGAAIPL